MNAVGWLQSNKKNLSPLGEKAATVVGELYNGIYHVDREALRADWSNESAVSICVRDSYFSTYDDSLLTDLVVLAHRHNVRATIRAAAHGYIRLIFVNVTKRGFSRDGHPTASELIDRVSTR